MRRGLAENPTTSPLIDPGELDRRGSPRSYPREWATELVYRWQQGNDEVLNDILRCVKRFAIMLINKRYRYFSLESREEALQSLLVRIWTWLREQRYTLSPERFHGYVFCTLINRARVDAKKNWNKPRANIDQSAFMASYFARIPDARNTETEIFVEELPNALVERALATTRFQKQEELLRYILNRLVRKETIREKWVERRYKIRGKQLQYFIEHAVLIVRFVMYDMRLEELSFRSDSESRFVFDEGVRHFFDAWEVA